ncbi:YggU family protein [Desulfobulbus sp. TB]|nr:YggU family protein [Desulfobulbus sp. TB]
MPYITEQPDGSLLLSIYVQPRSNHNAIVGLHGDAIKLRLTAPPVDGKANKAIIAFWAKSLKIPKSAITMKSGLHNRMKKILLNGVQEKQIRDLVECHL